jgi:putative oxidoreductase
VARRGVEPALVAAYLSIIVELVGTILITLGLFTRPVALLVVVEFLVIVKSHAAAGWSGAGAEFPFLWLIVFVVILLRGGGPYSLDARLGREV